nr:MAG TPA: hypothetical protein [Caudoviricetes sp.]
MQLHQDDELVSALALDTVYIPFRHMHIHAPSRCTSKLFVKTS